MEKRQYGPFCVGDVGDAIEARFCASLPQISSASDCADAAGKAIVEMNNMPVSDALGDVEIRSVSKIGDNLYSVGYAPKISGGFEINALTRYTEVLAQQESSVSCGARGIFRQ